MDCEALPTTAMCTAIFEFGCKLLNSYEVLVCVLFLGGRSAANEVMHYLPYLGILPWDLDLIEFSVLELNQIMA